MARTSEERKLANAQCARESRKRKNEQLVTLQEEIESYKRRLCEVERENVALRRSIHSCATGDTCENVASLPEATPVWPLVSPSLKATHISANACMQHTYQPAPEHSWLAPVQPAEMFTGGIVRTTKARSAKEDTEDTEDAAALNELLGIHVDLEEMECELALDKPALLTTDQFDSKVPPTGGAHATSGCNSAPGIQRVATFGSPVSNTQQATDKLNMPFLCLQTSKNVGGGAREHWSDPMWHEVPQTENQPTKVPGLQAMSTTDLPEATPVWPLVSQITQHDPIKATQISANACKQHTYQQTTWLTPEQSLNVAAVLGLPAGSTMPTQVTRVTAIPTVVVPTTAPTTNLAMHTWGNGSRHTQYN